MGPHQRTIAKLIKQAEHFIDHHDWDKAASRCYQVLALDTDNANAQNKLMLIYLQRELVNDMRLALQRLFDLADENVSPGQRRRMLAFSYRVLSCWKGWLKDDIEQTPPVDELEEVAQMLSRAYLRGDDADLLTAWNMFVQARQRHPANRRAIQWWMLKQYAEHGFFADAAEVLVEMRATDSEDVDARYLLAEMRWWRDHSDVLVWVP